MSKFLNDFLKFTGVAKGDHGSRATPSTSLSPNNNKIEDEDGPELLLGVDHFFR